MVKPVIGPNSQRNDRENQGLLFNLFRPIVIIKESYMDKNKTGYCDKDEDEVI